MARRIPSDIKERYRYDAYAQYNAAQLVGGLNEIEDSLLTDIYSACLSYLEGRDAVIRGETFLIGSRRYKLYVEFNRIQRILVLMVWPLTPPRSEPVTTSVAINDIGAIKSLEFIWPRALDRSMRSLVKLVEAQVRYAYLNLGTAFVTALKPLGAFVFDSLYDILNVEIRSRTKEPLIGKAFFNVTIRKSSRFRYFFTSEKLKTILDHFKANQLLEYSPLELACTLITSDATDTINLLMNVEQSQFAHIPSVDFVSADEDLRFWSSEALLLDYKELAAFTVTKTDKLILQVNCPREYEREFSEIFVACANALDAQFMKNIKTYLKHASDLTKLPETRFKTSRLQSVLELAAALLGKAAGIAIKEAASP